MAVSSALSLPRSATDMRINAFGLLLSVGALVAALYWELPLNRSGLLWLSILSYAAPIILLEWKFLRNRNDPSSRFNFSRAQPLNIARVAVKLYGLLVTLSAVALIYWLFPEYRGNFYDHYYSILRTLIAPLLILAVAYFLISDRYLLDPQDGYWHVGKLCLGSWSCVDKAILKLHSLSWLVKLFFLPLMYTYLHGKMGWLQGLNLADAFSSFRSFYDAVYNLLFYIDLLVAAVGYMLTIRIFDSHVRSTEPTLLGWFVTLECYQPFWSFSSRQYLAYDPVNPWGYWFGGSQILYPLWGSLILILLAIFAWATLSFGIRFSNLTHRGIITNGPYRYCKHPAYVSKNLSFWLISMPFLSTVGWPEALRHSSLLLLVNLIYLLRARTEERHLSADPKYVAYARCIERHGLFAPIGRYLPWLKFKPGRLFNVG